MTKHNICGRRRLTVLLCVLLLFCTALAPSVFAAGVTVSTTSSTAYFQTYASSGSWVDIGTPKHVINETGKVAYCLQTSLNSPSNSGYSAANWRDYYDQTTMTGLRAILEHGYPVSNGGFTDDQARYATANAIRFWLAERGCEGVPSWMNYSAYSYIFRAKSGYEDLFNWCIALLTLAQNQTVYTHSLSLSASTVTLTQNGDTFTGSVNVYLNNCNGGFEVSGSVPSGMNIQKSGSTVTISAPLTLAGKSYEFTVKGLDNRSEASLLFFAPDNANEQRVVSYTLDINSEVISTKFKVVIPEAANPTGSLSILKTDADTGEPLEGVSFLLYNGEGSNIASGKTNADGRISFTELPLGEYSYQEGSALPGYVLEDSMHPFTLTENGQVVAVTHQNKKRTASIQVKKQDAYGNSLAGAVFILEASTDGGTSYAPVAQGATSAGGLARFEGLEANTGTLYRLTEIQAPPGHSLQAGTIFNGTLPENGEYDLSYTVCDCAISSLPFTGSRFNFIPFIPLMLCMGFFVTQNLKRRKQHEENLQSLSLHHGYRGNLLPAHTGQRCQ